MTYRILANAVVLLHLAFVAFVIAGGLWALRSRRVMFLHLPAVLWGAYIEWSGGICPLTPLENEFRLRAGESGYEGGFVEHYLIPIIYPAGLTRDFQLVLAAAVVVINVLVYAFVWRRYRSPSK